MMKMIYLKEILTGQKPLIDVWHYIVGNYRYKLYYSMDSNRLVRACGGIHPLMRRHIWEQIVFRIRHMNKECFNSGECIKCGCQTTHLQMCSKECEGHCYPPMVDKKHWEMFINGFAKVRSRDNKRDYWFDKAKNEILIYESVFKERN